MLIISLMLTFHQDVWHSFACSTHGYLITELSGSDVCFEKREMLPSHWRDQHHLSSIQGIFSEGHMLYHSTQFVFCLFLAAQRFELRALYLLGRHSYHLSHSTSPNLYFDMLLQLERIFLEHFRVFIKIKIYCNLLSSNHCVIIIS
jgi:hypothetical protein